MAEKVYKRIKRELIMSRQANHLRGGIEGGWQSLKAQPGKMLSQLFRYKPLSTDPKPVKHAHSADQAISARWALIVVLISASVARVATLNDPFTRNHESTACGPMVAAARNMVRYGFFACHFGYVENSDWVDPSLFTYYNHHPPLVPIMQAVSAKIFGQEPWCYRLPGAICSVLTSGLLFLMLARKFDWRIGLAAGLLYALCPFMWLFGDMPDVVGPHMMLFGLLTIECYSRWSDDTGANQKWMYWAVGCWFLAAMCDWPAFFLVPILCVDFAIKHPYRSWWRVLPYCIISGLVLGTTLAWLMAGGDNSVIFETYRRVNGGASDAGLRIGLGSWLKVAIGYYVYHTFTLPVILLNLAYAGSIGLMLWRRAKGLLAHDTTLMMLAWGWMHVLIGFQSSYQHMWVWCVLVPGACAAAVLGAKAIWEMLPPLIQANPYAGNVAIGLAIIFGVSSYLEAKTLSDLGLPVEEAGYTMKDFGEVIRETVPSGQGVLTSDIGDPLTGQSEPALWFYADRQLRNGIRTVDQLDNSLDEGNYQIFYDFVQHGGPAPLWFVMPAEHHFRFKELAGALDSRYARWERRGFLIYYLGWTPEDQAKAAAASK